jgi:hypothetical protein
MQVCGLKKPFKPEGCDNDLWLQFFQDRSQPLGFQVGTKGDRHPPCLEDGVIADHVFGAVFKNQANSITLDNPLIQQTLRQVISLRIKLGVSRPGFLVDQSSLVRKGLSAFLKEVMDKSLGIGNYF